MSQALSLSNTSTSGLFFDKRFGTNLVAALLVGSGFLFSEPWSETLLNTGLFALSGAITNWLAIYMLFEHVPGLYGSGVILLHFEDFKVGIKELIMHQFFNRKNVEQFFDNSEGSVLLPDFELVFKRINLNPAFDSLLEVIESSSFGPVLSMLGGVQALESLREPFKEKLRGAVQKISETEPFQQAMREQLADLSTSDYILQKVEDIVCKRLDELTPNMVKEIVERMIHEHLSWLVVWGGVFGGLIGLLSTFVF